MFFTRRPGNARVRELIEAHASSPFTYEPSGGPLTTAPPGYGVHSHRAILGRGQASWERAVAALASWRMFDQGWLDLCFSDAPIEAGQVVAVRVRAFGLWSVNLCRIVHTFDEAGPPRRFGFAYGTLGRHAESGEERFAVVWDPTSDEVAFEILAFSRPHHPLARIARPWVRGLQARFGRDACEAMVRAVAEAPRAGENSEGRSRAGP